MFVLTQNKTKTADRKPLYLLMPSYTSLMCCDEPLIECNIESRNKWINIYPIMRGKTANLFDCKNTKYPQNGPVL